MIQSPGLPDIDADIRRAETPPAAFYRDADLFALQRERLFARSWQLLPDPRSLPPATSEDRGQAFPFTLLSGCLDEPLCLVRDGAGTLRCLGNVCTHRGAILVEKPVDCRTIRCRYHGRQFHLDGRFHSMPGFQGALGFPRPEDDLASLPIERLGSFHFTSLRPAFPFEEMAAPIRDRVGFLPLDRMTPEPDSGAGAYDVAAHWALYCDNYLEGMHVPFVHPALSQALDARDYRIETFRTSSLQIGMAATPEEAFELPAGHPDEGLSVAGYYAFLFPNTMLNFYPWGVSVNVVEPLSVNRTRIRYVTYVLDPSRRHRGAGSGLHQVEMEDEQVVASVQRGLAGRLYRRGRYAPEGEAAVHHFHRLAMELLAVS